MSLSDLDNPLISTAFPTVLLILASVQWVLCRFLKRFNRDAQIGAAIRGSRKQLATYLVFLLSSLIAFPLAAYAFWLLFFIPPWWVMLASAAGFVIDGVIGLTLSGGLIAAPKWAGRYMFITAIASIAIIGAALLRVFALP